jgi:hypothetical protein
MSPGELLRTYAARQLDVFWNVCRRGIVVEHRRTPLEDCENTELPTGVYRLNFAKSDADLYASLAPDIREHDNDADYASEQELTDDVPDDHCDDDELGSMFFLDIAEKERGDPLAQHWIVNPVEYGIADSFEPVWPAVADLFVSRDELIRLNNALKTAKRGKAREENTAARDSEPPRSLAANNIARTLSAPSSGITASATIDSTFKADRIVRISHDPEMMVWPDKHPSAQGRLPSRPSVGQHHCHAARHAESVWLGDDDAGGLPIEHQVSNDISEHFIGATTSANRKLSVPSRGGRGNDRRCRDSYLNRIVV